MTRTQLTDLTAMLIRTQLTETAGSGPIADEPSPFPSGHPSIDAWGDPHRRVWGDPLVEE